MRLEKIVAPLMVLGGIALGIMGCKSGTETTKDYTAEKTTITKAADHLVTLQHSDGGFTWYLPGDANSDPNVSYPNMYGVVGLGLLDAYRTTNDAKYLDAAQKTADHLLSIISDNLTATNDTTFYASDTEFLAEFGKTVGGDNVYTAKAKTITDHFVTQSNYINTSGALTAALLDIHYRNATDNNLGLQWRGLAEWMLADWLRGMQLTGHDSFANDLAGIMKNDMSGTSPYFDINNTSQSAYILGLASELAATGDSGAKQKLIAAQKSDGSWEDPNGVVQDTAYAVMALAKTGSMDAASSGVKSEISSQSATGAFTEVDGKDYPEVDSEAIQSIYEYMTQP
ncbi:MAG TPA: hypothetical protein VMC07_03120 [Candidatus Omnitrophota bacterium]|nr:hypothetical protein [Candidatus Omnitrophota bacterium]